MLEDLVFPAEIVGKRTRFRRDSTAILKVHLDKAQQNNVEHKVKRLICFFVATWQYGTAMLILL